MAPARSAIVGRAVTKTVGIPRSSKTLANVAPQRVPVPQVPVRTMASTPASANSSAISCPIRVDIATDVLLPVVT